MAFHRISKISDRIFMHKYIDLRSKTFWFFVFIIIIALFFRLQDLGRGWTYDEIWSLKEWAERSNWKILSALNDPNNHPLNSIFMKYTYSIWGLNSVAIRFHDFAAGVLIVPVVYFIVLSWIRNRYIALLASIFTAAHGGLVYYSQIARGYSLQAFLIVLFCLLSFIWIKYSYSLSRLKRCCLAAGLVISMVTACMTLCTAILFIVPIMLYHLLVLLHHYLPGKLKITRKLLNLLNENIELIIAWAVITLFAIFLYLGNYDKFTGAIPAASGIKVKSFNDLFLFLKNVFSIFMPYWMLVPVIFALLRPRFRKVIIFLLLLCVFSFSTIFFAKGGPARAYLPLVPFFCIASACGFYNLLRIIAQKHYRKLKYPALIILALASILTTGQVMRDWGEPDSKADFEAISKLPADYMVVYSANYTFPLGFNNRPQVYVDNFTRISNCRDGGKLLLLRSINNDISALDNNQSEIGVPIDVKGKAVKFGDLDFSEYKLQHISETDIRNKTLIAIVHFNSKQITDAAIKFLRGKFNGNWLLLNCWLNVALFKGDEKFSAAALVSPPQFMPMKNELLEIERNSQGRVKFFVIAAAPGQN